MTPMAEQKQKGRRPRLSMPTLMPTLMPMPVALVSSARRFQCSTSTAARRFRCSFGVYACAVRKGQGCGWFGYAQEELEVSDIVEDVVFLPVQP